MKKAKIAEFKARLSWYLRRVQKGEPLLVMDRATPIARVEPYRVPKDEFVTIPAKKPFKWFWDRKPMKLRHPPTHDEILKALDEERADRDLM